MATLNSSLIDKARVIRAVAAAPRIEGQSPLSDVAGAWFAARLVPTGAPEVDEPGGVRVVAARAMLVCPPGVEIRASDRVEVQSKWVGSAIWRVTGQPEAATTRRAVWGLVAAVERV